MATTVAIVTSRGMMLAHVALPSRLNDACDEEPYSRRNCLLYGFRNGVKDQLAQTRDRQKDEQNAVNQNEQQGVGIAEAHAEAYGKDEECVQSHAGRLREREVGEQTDEQRSDNSRERRCNVDGAEGDISKRGEHSGVDRQDVGHCHEGRDTADQFGFYGRVAVLQMEQLFHDGEFTSFHSILSRKPYYIIQKEKSQPYFAFLSPDGRFCRKISNARTAQAAEEEREPRNSRP